jgi:hypothetical protein
LGSLKLSQFQFLLIQYATDELKVWPFNAAASAMAARKPAAGKRTQRRMTVSVVAGVRATSHAKAKTIEQRGQILTGKALAISADCRVKPPNRVIIRAGRQV